MYLSQLVTINEKAIVANAVNFGLMDDPAKNLLLCEGFVFNYDSNKPKSSTVGVLDALRRSFHSPNEPNIHLMVQDYGKGKSHFALAIANFFQRHYNSPEVEGVLRQVEYATSSTNQVLDALKHYKQQGRNLVICLSGDKSDKDLKRQFIQAVKKTLNIEGITDVIAQKICSEPLDYLENLSPEHRELAEAYLQEIGNPEGDVDEIINNLRENNYQLVNRVKQIYRHINKYTPDFEADIDVEEILTELVDKLCTGDDRRFNGILIIFDELYNYLQNWSTDPAAAGSTTLQNITNICERYKGKIALLSLTQRRPGRVSPSKNVEDYNRLVSRVELITSTYEPATSLESVLNNLLSQQTQTSTWQEFEKKWRDTLNDINTKMFQYRTANYYQSRNWQAEKFRKEITLGCFPLHPLTSYLLCNLDFTQGRGAIQFVQETVNNFIQQQPVEVNGSINFLYPVQLVDALENNFYKSSDSDYSTSFSDYISAINKVKASADALPEELLILKALLLFNTSNGKLVKSDKEKHEEFLSLLTGLSIKKTKETLDQLEKVRGVIYLNEADNTYRFFTGGVGIDEIKRQIKEKTINKFPSIEAVVNFCQTHISKFAGDENTIPNQFIAKNGLRSEDWKYQNQVYTVPKFKQALLNSKTLDVNASGIVAYVVGETQEQLLELRNEINQLLQRSPNKGQIVVAIISQPINKLAIALMEYKALEIMRQDNSTAVAQVKQLYEKEINNSAIELFKSCIYHCHILDKIPTGEHNNISKIVSAALEDRYPFVPTVNSNDKLYFGHATGAKVIGSLSKCLLEDNTLPQAFLDKSYKTVVDQVFTNSWGLFKLDNQKYVVAVPTHRNIKEAWDKISDLMAFDDKSEKIVEVSKIWETLSSPPYGYNPYTFTILLAGWLAYHRSELLINGAFGIPLKKTEQVTVRREPVKSWASINVFEKPRDFITLWVKNGRNSIIRRKPTLYPQVPNSINYDEAQQFIQDITDYIANEQDASKIKKIRVDEQMLIMGIEQLDKLIEPIAKAEDILQADNLSTDIDIESFFSISESLQKPLSTVVAGRLSITPTQQQQERRLYALQAVITKIEQIIDLECARVNLLKTQVECETYKADINKLQSKVSQTTYLPPRFLEKLQSATLAGDSRLSEIVEQSKIDSCINDVHKLYNSLNALATQSECDDIQAQIENLVREVPIVRDKDTYKNIIRQIQAKKETILQEISDCENSFSSSMSKVLAVNLNKRINRLSPRLTNEACKKRLDDLSSRLDDIILERDNEDREANDINYTIDIARRKLAEAKIAKQLSDIFKAYKEIEGLKLPLQIKSTALKNKPAELNSLKSETEELVRGKITQVIEKCDQPISQKLDYEQLQDSLQQVKEFITTCDDFRRLSDDLREAEDNLQGQYDEFQKHEQDSKTIEAIRQKTLKNANTIHLCEEAIADIEIFRRKFNYLEKFVSEVDRLVKDFTDKVNSYKQKLEILQEKLSTAKTSQEVANIRNTHAQLKLIFNDSSEYSTYQELQAAIDSLAADVERINYWEGLYKQSNSIASCNSILETVTQDEASLHNVERFKPHLEQLKANLASQKQDYIDQLDELKAQLGSIINQKEAQRLQEELTRKSFYYIDSPEQQSYQELRSELSTLNTLLQIYADRKVDTVDNCTQEIARLQDWRQSKGQITATVQARFDTILNDLEETRRQLENQQIEAAKQWFRELTIQKLNLENSSETTNINNATNLLKKIQTERSKYEKILQEKQKEDLEQIIISCKGIENKNTESKIIVLFQKLPRSKREALLRKLAEINTTVTEKF
ncbi:hypothetical protein NIES4071_83640 [Calothrix sp. NIES-4071]|nr:hypothetical protein NIES4071_83640 [Calothrix sp. NIES-4071]BAZ62632.1 hypothetical protein NIES4105_83570 [Calothrix sp. NIES-4105]